MRGSSLAMERDGASESVHGKMYWIDYAMLGLVCLMPLFPRPTIDSVLKFIAPGSIVVVASLFAIWIVNGRALILRRNREIWLMMTIGASILGFYGARIFMKSEWGEMPYFVSRSLGFLLMVMLSLWILMRRIDIQKLFSAVLVGFIALSVIVIFCGISGVALFGELRPSRDYMVQLPFYKTTGVPRSYGEFGILASAAWAYLLTEKKRLNVAGKMFFGALVLLAVAISQSRSTYLAILFVTGSHLILYVAKSRWIRSLLIITALVLPLMLEAMSDELQAIPVVRGFLGEGVVNKNVYSRLAINRVALDFLTSSPADLAFGSGHTEWLEALYENEGLEGALHNHFLSNAVFLGVVGGTLSVLLLLWPVMFIAWKIRLDRESQLLILASVGAISCLQFYEGFFSIILIAEMSAFWCKYARRGKQN